MDHSRCVLSSEWCEGSLYAPLSKLISSVSAVKPQVLKVLMPGRPPQSGPRGRLGFVALVLYSVLNWDLCHGETKEKLTFWKDQHQTAKADRSGY